VAVETLLAPVELSAVSAQQTTPAAGEPPPTFDQRWAAWEAKGAAHDRALRRKLAIAAPILLLIAVVVLYLLLKA
jgi:hypothetical protein